MTSETSTPEASQSAGWRGTFAVFALGLSIFSIFWFALAAVGTKLGFWTWQIGLGVMTIGWGPMLLMAAIPLATTTASSAPSIAASFCSSAVEVGLPIRL